MPESKTLLFSAELQSVMTKAYEEATRRNSPVVGTMHILLAALTVEESGAARVIGDLKVDKEALAEEVRKKLRIHPRSSSPMTPGLEGHVQIAMNRAELLAKDFGHKEIGSEHLLFGISSDPHNIAMRFLDDRGVHMGHIRSLAHRYSRKHITHPA